MRRQRNGAKMVSARTWGVSMERRLGRRGACAETSAQRWKSAAGSRARPVPAAALGKDARRPPRRARCSNTKRITRSRAGVRAALPPAGVNRGLVQQGSCAGCAARNPQGSASSASGSKDLYPDRLPTLHLRWPRPAVKRKEARLREYSARSQETRSSESPPTAKPKRQSTMPHQQTHEGVARSTRRK